MPPTGQIRTLVILGGGTAGWMAAAAFANYLGGGVSITLIESEEIGAVGVGEATIPSIRRFHSALGIDEAGFMQATGATYKLGIEFADWRVPGERYFHAFGKLGKPVDGVGFLHAYLRLRSEGTGDSLWRYSPNAVAAQAGRFGGPTGVDARMGNAFPYAYHLDAGRYARLLRDYAERRGVRRVAGTVCEVLQNEAGDVTELHLTDGTRQSGDFFVDCSGGRAVLIGDVMGCRWEDWGAFLPCDRATVVQTEPARHAIPYTRATAMSAGWRWSIPLQHRVGNGYVYSSAHCHPERAETALLSTVEGKVVAQPRTLTFRVGRQSSCWRGNVVAIGLSAGFLEPLESTSIHLIQTGITQFLNLFPRDEASPALAQEYNRIMGTTFENVRDFIILHYVATSRNGDPLWDYVRTMPLPDTLRQRMGLFEEYGRIVRDENELFTTDSWIAVMLGQGVIPRSYSPLADAIPSQKLRAVAAEHLKKIRNAVGTMRRYDPIDV